MDIKLSSDLELIIESCKENQDKDLINDKISKIKNWDTFINLSDGNGVFPLVFQTLKEYNLNIPQDIFLKMKSLNLDILKENMYMTSELIRITKLFDANNIEVISFKGPSLSSLAYGNITLRQYSDLDLLINPNDFDKVFNIMNNNIYYTKYDYSRALEKVKELIPDHLFINKNTNLIIEIHNKLFSNNFPIDIKDNIFFENIDYVEINGNNIKTFKSEYLLYYLCLHGTKHLFSRVYWILDIHKLIKSENDFDWKLFIDIVNKTKTKTMVFVSLYLSKTLFNTNIPSFILDKFNIKHEYLVKYIINNRDKEDELTSRFTIQNLIMFDTFSSKLKYCFYLFQPSVIDYQMFEKLYKIKAIYYVLRPFNLVKRYFLKNKNY